MDVTSSEDIELMMTTLVVTTSSPTIKTSSSSLCQDCDVDIAVTNDNGSMRAKIAENVIPGIFIIMITLRYNIDTYINAYINK